MWCRFLSRDNRDVLRGRLLKNSKAMTEDDLLEAFAHTTGGTDIDPFFMDTEIWSAVHPTTIPGDIWVEYILYEKNGCSDAVFRGFAPRFWWLRVRRWTLKQ